MPAPSPHLPNAFVFQGPYLFQVGHENVLKIPGLGEVLNTADARLVHCVQDFAENVEPNSRLSCQIKVSDELDGLIVRMPESQH